MPCNLLDKRIVQLSLFFLPDSNRFKNKAYLHSKEALNGKQRSLVCDANKASFYTGHYHTVTQRVAEPLL